MSDVQLFEVDLTPVGMTDRVGKPSPDRARTERRRLLIARGEHPTGNGPINRERQCGECVHCVLRSNGNRQWWKCESSRLGTSHSAASDIRLSWPACPRFELRP